MHQLVGWWAVISTVTVRLGRRQMSYELIDWLFSSLNVIGHRKVTALAPLHVVIQRSIE